MGYFTSKLTDLHLATVKAATADEDRATVNGTETNREIAKHLGDRADENQVVLTRLQRHVDVAAGAFLVGLIALGVAPWDVLT